MRYIEINGRKYYVSDEVFFAMRKSIRREKYLTERDRDNGSVSYEALEAVVSADITVETEFDMNERSNRLWAALCSLDERDFNLITRLYFELADTDELKGLVNDGDTYSKKISEYKNAEVLYIDDFFKMKRGEAIKPADINLAFEIIDRRCCMKMKTIISSEFSIDEVISADEATGGRIKQMCGKYVCNVRPDRAKITD